MFFLKMKYRLILFLTLLALFVSGCAQQQADHNVAGTDLKKITQLDLNTNKPIKSWNAHADTIKQHFAPPVGITFVDADTGKTVHFEGTFRIESYQSMSDAAAYSSPTSHP